jgi:hypothetical protein
MSAIDFPEPARAPEVSRLDDRYGTLVEHGEFFTGSLILVGQL